MLETRLRACTVGVLCAALAWGSPAAALAAENAQVPPTPAADDPDEARGTEAAPRGTSLLRGVVRDAEGEPRPAARVMLVAIEGDEYADRYEARTDSGGQYEIDSLPYGYYRVVVEHEGQLFPANRVLLVPPGKKIEADWTLGPFEAEDLALGLAPDQPLEWAAGGAASGVARLVERSGPSGWAWLRTGKGVAVLLGAGTLLVGGLIALSDDDEPIVSPSSP
ncbi:MAG: carboxypeptidase regulatory-like domain-containing protein [Acidobacteriota bacterium]|nr:MAG: carboxypeptidase regulatory-like domain-containing protein [Acidobacteriota bacterium]